VQRSFFLLVLTLAVAACDSDEDFIGAPPGNSSPTTELTARPPVLHGSSSRVAFSWWGRDFDGQIVGYEWKLTDNGADGIVDAGDLLAQPWRFTTARDSVFRVSADMDSFPDDNESPDEAPRFWQTHTFFVRAVDDRGARDPTPAEVSFTAVTIAPSVELELQEGELSNRCVVSTGSLSFSWKVEDQDAELGDAFETRYLLRQARRGNGECFTASEFDLDPPVNGQSLGWSKWEHYDRLTGGGARADFTGREHGERLVFAVQARDATGATTPTFRWEKNARHVVIQEHAPTLLYEGGEYTGFSNSIYVEALPGQELYFVWFGTAESYGGSITGYRHGWDLRNPRDPDDPRWSVWWGLLPHNQSVTKTLDWGTHILTLQCRDEAAAIASLNVVVSLPSAPPLSERRPLLFVDDWRNAPGSEVPEQRWNDELLGLLVGHLAGFDPETDFVEASAQQDRLKISSLSRYRGILWMGNSDEESFLHRRLGNLGDSWDYQRGIEYFQRYVGNLLLVGPGVMGNTVETNLAGWIYPLIFDLPAGGQFGFGMETGSDGHSYNAGLRRWPSSAWCLESVDRARPPIGYVFGEHNRPGTRLRSLECDGLYVAAVAEEFSERYPRAESPPYGVRDLLPAAERIAKDSRYRPNSEEFYDWNATNRPIVVQPRRCQTPMYRWVSRRDFDEWRLEEYGEIVSPVVAADSLNCFPIRRTQSPMNLAAAAVASSMYSDRKHIRGSHDFVWGFHPLSFEREGISAAFRWVLNADWELAYH
jgi:hypothetical protein